MKVADDVLFYSKELNTIFQPGGWFRLKEDLRSIFGSNVPSWVERSKSNVICDKSILNYVSEQENDEFASIAHHCVYKYGVAGFVYDWDKLISEISKLTFIKIVKAAPWASEGDDEFYSINRKRLKKWFKANHNRFLLSHKNRPKFQMKYLSDNSCYAFASYEP